MSDTISKITLQDIARTLNITAATVSRALSNHPAIKEATKKMVRDAYVPYMAIAAPLICIGAKFLLDQWTGYKMGIELLLLNGFLMFTFLWIFSIFTRHPEQS